ncbi:MAG TPA: alpha/beta hydrolase [Gaiellaceae bacterium]|nr:alpha/beta hydrolase [Gaiellaceae bacterium]
MAVTESNPVLAETRAFNAQLADLLATMPPLASVPIEVTRRVRRERGGIFPAPVRLPQARELAIPGRAGELRLRVLAPPYEPVGVYLHVHGGGFCLGACDQQDPRLAALAEATGLVAASVEYRLAPEHPFPAALDDCEDAAAWLLEQGAAELGAPAAFAIGGESAGAYLAATTLLRTRDRGAFRAANLAYGVYDCSHTPSRRAADEQTLVISGSTLDFFDRSFMPGARDPERLRDPAISPLYADLRDLPPALFTVGTNDPLLDDTLFMAARWRAAGNRTELQVLEEAAHAFNLFPLAAARIANEAQHRFLAEAFA